MMRIFFTIIIVSFFSLANAQMGIQLADITSDKTTFSTPETIQTPPSLAQVFGSTSTTLQDVLKADYNTHQAFFCKVEVKLEKAAKFPIKFRLGDVETVDKLEGKRRSY